jgi:ribonuclease BN (tRNA processing enzyme)
MKLKILGTGTATPSLQRASSSCLLSTTWGTILVDIGPSVVRRLLEYGHTTDDVDMIVLTHFHPDHTVDLATFLFASNYGDITREKPLILLGGRGLEGFYENFVRLYRWLSPVGYDLILKSLPAGEWSLGKVSIKTSKSNHNPESIAVRVTEGKNRAKSGAKSIVFTGDTDFSKELVALAARADLVVSECSFPERKVQGHLNLADLQRIVKEAKPKQVVLSHLYPDWEAFDGVLHAPLLLGIDGLEIEL